MTTALVVDDSPGDRRLATLILGEGIATRVVDAENGTQALARLAENTADVVVTDLRMPDMDGLELVEAIRRRGLHVPVVLMTGHGSEEIASEALRRGAASYVPKRYLMRDLADTVRTVLAASAPSRNLRQLATCVRTMQWHCALETNPDFVHPLVTHLQAYLMPMGICDHSSSMQVGIALVEAIHNGIFHGNLELDSALREHNNDEYLRLAEVRRHERPYCERTIEVSMTLSPSTVKYVVCDEGPGFDPSSVPDPSDPANMDRCSGRGLLLIRTFMDEVAHNEDGNQITMVKCAAS